MSSNAKIIFIIGGCKSGKSDYALKKAQEFQTGTKKFLATSLVLDEEMQDRVARHREQRRNSWETIETPFELPSVLSRNFGENSLLLVDCLSMWVNNMILKEYSEKELNNAFSSFVEALKNTRVPVILISNEVGTGIVPEDKLARRFRDYLGRLNQEAAACADSVFWTIAGLPVSIK